MARQITDEKIKLSIIIDGNPAQKELYDLEKSTRSLNNANKDLKKERALLAAQGKKDTEEYRKLNVSIRENTTAITANKARMSELQKQIGVTGLTMGQLQAKARELTFKLRNLIPGSEDYIRYSAELKTISTRMDELRGKSTAAGFSIGRLADNFNRYAALGASIIATGTGVVLSLQKMIDYNGKLSDAQADVMKTTQMSKQEVDELTKSFGALQTRTSRINLLGIAEQGGRIGIRKEEIQDFVNVMDKANVALGDSFTGGAEEVAEKLGKIKFLFEETKKLGVEESYMAIGSSINDLGANGVASERNIAEFTTRIGSLPSVLKPSVAETLALGAAFEESGIEAEISARAYNIFLKQASTEAGKFAKVMGVSKDQVEKLINENPLEFMLQFAQGFKGVNMEATDTAKILDYLGINADGANKAIGAMANNTDRFRELIDISNQSFADGTSLINEYNIKNNTLGATLEKIKKKVTGWFSSDSLVEFLAAAAEKFAIFIGATEDADGKGKRWRNTLAFTAKAIAVVISALLTSVTWMKLTALWTTRNTEATLLYNLGMRARAVAEGLAAAGTRALSLAQNLLTFNIKGAIQAFRALSASMMTTPWGLILGFVSAIATAYYVFGENAEKVNREQEAFNNIRAKVISDLDVEKKKMQGLLDIARDENSTKEAKMEAIKALNELSPEYLGNLKLETINTKEATQATEAYIKSLERKLEAEHLDAEVKEAMSRKDEIYRKGSKEYQKWYDGMFDWQTEKARNKTATERLEADIAKEDAVIARLMERRKKLMQESPELINDSGAGTGTSNYTVPDDKESDAEQKKRDKELEELAKFEEDVLDLKRRVTDERLAQMQDGFLKEKMIEDENHRRKIEDLKKQLISEKDMMAADQKINSPNASNSDIDYWTRQKEAWVEKNRHLNDLIEIEERRHVLTLETIDLKGQTDRINDLQEAYDKESLIRETAHNNAIAALGTNEEAKKVLQQQYQSDELDRQEAHLTMLLDEYKRMLAGDNPEVQLDLLPKDQVDDLSEKADFLTLKLSEIAKAKNALKNGESSDDFISAAQNVFGNADILGFTEDQWEQTFANLDTMQQKLNATQMVIGGMQNLWSSYNNFVAAGENRQLANFENNSNAKKRKLKWQLDNGYINQLQYRKGIEQLDADLERKKAEIEYKQAKRKKTMAIIEATINTAVGVTSAIPNYVLMALAAAAGAIEIAAIARQPLPARGFETGLYQDVVREQDGKKFKSRFGGKTKSGLVTKPTHFLTGENGPEMIIDSKAYRKISPETRYALEREIRQIKGFEKGYYSDDIRKPVYQSPENTQASAGSEATSEILAGIISKNTEILEKLYAEGVVAWVSRDPRNLKKLEEDIERVKSSREKAKQ